MSDLHIISHDMTAQEAASESVRLIRPLRLSLIIAISFLAVSLLYIVISGQIAAQSSRSVVELQSIEKLKGSIYVVTASILLFTLSFVLFKRIERREKELAKFRNGLIAAERRAAAGLFASSVAHDMSNVLMIVEYATHCLGRSEAADDEEILAKLRQANTELQKLSSLLGRASGLNLQESETEFDLATLLNETIELARRHKKVYYCSISVTAPQSLRFCGIPVLIHQMLLNLLINAADATNRKGSIAVKLSMSGSNAMIEVHDDGPGILENQKAIIMEPFVTTKLDGSGLGLLSVKVCAESHNGRIQIEKSHLGGACFKVLLKSKSPESSGLQVSTHPDLASTPPS